MMKIIFALTAVALSGCSLLPRAHDPVLADRWVSTYISVNSVDCTSTNAWADAMANSEHLYRLASFRNDPQSENLEGLYKHTVKMNKSTSKVFCELGKRTAISRLDAAHTAWEGR